MCGLRPLALRSAAEDLVLAVAEVRYAQARHYTHIASSAACDVEYLLDITIQTYLRSMTWDGPRWILPWMCGVLALLRYASRVCLLGLRPTRYTFGARVHSEP